MKFVIFLFVAIACFGTAVYLSSPTQSETLSPKAKVDGDLISGYKKWTRVNAEPKIVPSRIAIQCAAVSLREQEQEQLNPHRDKYVVVYVNDIGRSAMMDQKLPHFPQGSLVVKEKLSTKDSQQPELLTVMRKREPGYNPESGDWEYMVFDGPGEVLQAGGKLENCQACHAKEKNTDYISRAYMAYDHWQKLR